MLYQHGGRHHGDRRCYSLSDERLKEDIETLDGSKVYDMRGVSFTKDGREGRVIAQSFGRFQSLFTMTANTCQWPMGTSWAT